MEQIEKTEKYILVAVATGEEEAAWASLEELGELVRTDGAEVSSMVVQNLDHLERATYVGSGKAWKFGRCWRYKKRTESSVTMN